VPGRRSAAGSSPPCAPHQEVAPAHGAGTEAAIGRLPGHHTLATKLVNELVEAADDKILSKIIVLYSRVDRMCTDELAYMALDRHGAELTVQDLTVAQEKHSVAIASNESCGGSKTFTDPKLARRDR
jgi:hypothetical protein